MEDWDALLAVLDQKSTPSSKQEIINHLETRLNILAKAVNDRRTAPEDPVYQRTIDMASFEGTIRHPFKHDVNWWEFRANFVEFIDEFPEYSIVPLSINTTVDEKAGSAMSFVNMQHIGQPAGVVRQGVAFFRFRRRILDGGRQQWLCCRLEFMDGVDGSEHKPLTGMS